MAHVSKGTVSRVINGVSGVGDDTRRRVLKLIESLDFHPDASARGLAARKTNTMGFVIPHTGKYTLTSTFWPVFLTIVTQEAAARGINVLLSTARSEDDVDSAFRSILRGRRIDGAIIGAEQFGDKQLAELLLKNVPFVIVGRTPRIPTHYVDVDNALGARIGAEHLAALGHTRLAVLAGPDTLPYVHDRVRGVRETCRERGLPEPMVVHSPYDTVEAARCVEGILLSRPEITGIFVAAGDLVIGTLRACAELRQVGPGRCLGGVVRRSPLLRPPHAQCHGNRAAHRGDRRGGRGDAFRAHGGAGAGTRGGDHPAPPGGTRVGRGRPASRFRRRPT